MLGRIGPYRIQRRLGEGPRGAVYRAIGPDGARVAVKRLEFEPRASAHERRVAADEFGSQFRATRDADLAGVVRHLDWGEGDGHLWCALQLRPEPTLADLLAGGAPAGEVGLTLLRGIAATLDRVHEAGLLAHNLRPGNVFVAAEGPLLTDLVRHDRLGRILSGSRPSWERARWAAPEEILGYERSAATDRYVFARLALRLSTERPLFDERDPFVYLRAVIEERPYLDHLPARCVPVFQRALARRPARRPETATMLVEELAAALDEDTALEPVATDSPALSPVPPPAGAPRPPSPRTPPAPRRRLRSWLGRILGRRSARPRRLSGELARQGDLEGWQAMLPSWRIEVRSAAREASVWVDGVLCGAAGQTFVFERAAGSEVELEVRVEGELRARRRIRLHPMMDPVWDVDAPGEAPVA